MKRATSTPVRSSICCFTMLLLCASQSACVTSSPMTHVYLDATADNVLIFSKHKTITVSAHDNGSLVERNLSDSVKSVLAQDGFNVGGLANYDYILQVSSAYGKTSRTVYRDVVSSSYSSVAIAGQNGDVSTSTYTSVPTQEQSVYRAVSLILWDAQDTSHRLPVIWRGTIVGPAQTIDGHETSAIRQLVARIGTTAKTNLVLKDDVAGAVSPSQPASTVKPPSSSWSKYFSVNGIQVNELSRTFNSKKFDVYVKTRHVNTRKFNGFIQTEGYAKYDAPDSELPTFALGLGAYFVTMNGIYTVFGGDIRNLDASKAQKVISRPIKIGEKNAISSGSGSSIEYTVERREAITTPAGKYSDCVVIKYSATFRGKSSGERDWFCSGVGIAKQETWSNGAKSILTNVIHVKRE